MHSHHEAEDPRQAAIERAFTHNAICQISWEGVWGLGAPCCLLWTTVPAYLLEIGASKTLVQVVMLGFTVLTILQLAGARLVHGSRRKYQIFGIWCVFCLGFPVYATLALAGWNHLPESVWIPAFIAIVIVMGIAMNMGSGTYTELVLENMPVRKRGRVAALRLIVLGLVGMVGIWLASRVMALWESPFNFHYAMIIGSTIMLISCFAVVAIRDEAARFDRQQQASSPAILPAIRTLLGNFNFRVFLLFHAMLVAALSLAPLLIGYGKDVLGMASQEVAWFTGAYFIGPIIVGVGILPLADKFGFRLIGILTSLTVTTIYVLPFIGSNNRYLVLVSYVLYAGSQSCVILTLANLGNELVPEVKPSVLIAVGSILMAPLGLIFAPVGGRLADIYGKPGYLASFIMGATLGICALAGFLLLVREPRTGEEIYVRVRPT